MPPHRGHAVGARAAASRLTHNVSRPTASTPSGSCCTARRPASCFGSVASRNETLEVSINGGAAVALLPIDYRNYRDRQERASTWSRPAHSRQGGPAARGRRLHPELRTGVVDDLVAPIEHTLADTEYGDKRRHYDPSRTCATSASRGALHRQRRVGHAEPPQGVHLPADRRRRRDSVARAKDHRAGWRAMPTAGPRTTRDGRVADGVSTPRGAASHDFEAGIRSALQAVLASPSFPVPHRGNAGRRPAWPELPRITDLDLASRLSYFPVGHGRLTRNLGEGGGPTTRCTRRARPRQSRSSACCSDPRSEALSTRFASQLAAAAGRGQDPARRAALSRPTTLPAQRGPTSGETELMFQSIVREDRNILERHPPPTTPTSTSASPRSTRCRTSSGEEFRRVQLTDVNPSAGSSARAAC